MECRVKFRVSRAPGVKPGGSPERRKVAVTLRDGIAYFFIVAQGELKLSADSSTGQSLGVLEWFPERGLRFSPMQSIGDTVKVDHEVVEETFLSVGTQVSGGSFVIEFLEVPQPAESLERTEVSAEAAGPGPDPEELLEEARAHAPHPEEISLAPPVEDTPAPFTNATSGSAPDLESGPHQPTWAKAPEVMLDFDQAPLERSIKFEDLSKRVPQMGRHRPSPDAEAKEWTNRVTGWVKKPSFVRATFVSVFAATLIAVGGLVFQEWNKMGQPREMQRVLASVDKKTGLTEQFQRWVRHLAGLPQSESVPAPVIEPRVFLEAIAAGERAQVLRWIGLKQVDLDGQDVHGTTALMVAVAKGDAELVTFLLERGARKDIRRRDGKSAYDIALAMGRADLAQQVY